MAVNKDSNAYTITFAIILVIIVGGLLAFISNGLKPLQDKNLKNEKKQYILNCLPGNKLISRDKAGTEFANYVSKIRESEIILGNEVKQINKYEHHKYKVRWIFYINKSL